MFIRKKLLKKAEEKNVQWKKPPPTFLREELLLVLFPSCAEIPYYATVQDSCSFFFSYIYNAFTFSQANAKRLPL